MHHVTTDHPRKRGRQRCSTVIVVYMSRVFVACFSMYVWSNCYVLQEWCVRCPLCCVGFLRHHRYVIGRGREGRVDVGRDGCW